MSQVDYLHFFNNIVWDLIQWIIMYFIICVFYVQNFYKVLRLRSWNYRLLNIVIAKQDFIITEIFKDINKKFNKKISKFKSYNFLQQMEPLKKKWHFG